MTHFTVGIIVPTAYIASVSSFIDSQMAPFNEELRTAFVDVEDEIRGRYLTESTRMIKDPDTGKVYLPWDELFRVPGTIGTGRDFRTGDETHKFPDGWLEVDVPFKDRYATFEEFAKDWCGLNERDQQHGRFGYWNNPKAKWDWYRVGGRWDGWLIDNEKTSRNGFNFGSEHETIENNISTTEAALAKEKITHAIITPDGAWHERGEMGWFGILRTENDGWEEQAKALYAKYPGHSVVIVDAHI
jgi:hypothetical protein